MTMERGLFDPVPSAAKLYPHALRTAAAMYAMDNHLLPLFSQYEGLARQAFHQLALAVYRHPPLPPSETPAEVMKVLWSVQEGFLQAAIDAIEADHGGIERYLSQRLGLGPSARAALTARYLEDR